ncbi:unnamed protein product [Symbiodinium pilosum]|uniref:PROP1-like PPR domain-containing protein n=1 Tax=Symbiodinium pilosum TaxID=2952 RepID=A0A812QU67_SYMPI|nr:unnamed protein product [Symbiodinium pilosum]
MTGAGSFILAVAVIFFSPACAARDDCAVGSLHDILATAQEMILLIAAFTIGWHLIGPFLGFVTRQSRAITICATPRDPHARAMQAQGSEEQGTAPTESVTATGRAFVDAQRQEPRAFPPGRPDVAVDRWIAEGTSQPDAKLHADVFEACVQLGDFDSAHRLARHTAWRVPEGAKGPSQVLALARWLARRQDMEAAEKCMQQVRQTGHAVDLRTMKSMIIVCARVGRMDLGTALFQQLAADKLKPDFATYSAMIRGLCNIGQVEDALAYVEIMRRDAIRLDAMLFDVLLEGCVHQNNYRGAERLLAQMQEVGIQPSNATLAACIRLYSSRGELKRAMSMFEDMSREYHLQPNAYVYGALVAACIRCGKPEMALSTHEQMVADGCSPSARIYELLLQCCIQLGWTAKAVELLDAALGLRVAEGPASRSVPRTQAFIDPKVVEDLLLLLARRKQASSLGVPLLKRLEEADFELPERAAGLAAAAEAEQAERLVETARCGRRRDFDQWRNFEVTA